MLQSGLLNIRLKVNSFSVAKCMLVQVKLLYNILSETKYTMHLFQLCPLCACQLLPTCCWCRWKTAIRLNNTRQQLCHTYILYIYYLHIICLLVYTYDCTYMSMYVCCQRKFDLIWSFIILVTVFLSCVCDKAGSPPLYHFYFSDVFIGAADEYLRCRHTREWYI